MARTSAPHSASAQFFINATDNDFLNFKSESPSGWGYAVFGKVVSGTEVVDQIEKVKTGRKGFHDGRARRRRADHQGRGALKVNGQTPCPASPQVLAPPDTPPSWRCACLRAPDAWTCIDFISDLHLDQAHPLTQQAFVDYLDQTPASAVMILGDLFRGLGGR